MKWNKRRSIKHYILIDSSLTNILKPNEYVILSKIIDVHNSLLKSALSNYVNEPFELPLCDLLGMTKRINKQQINDIIHTFCREVKYIDGLPPIQLLSVTYKAKGKPSQYQFHIEAYKQLVKQSKGWISIIERNNKCLLKKKYDEVFNDLIGRNVKRIDKYNALCSLQLSNGL